MILNKLRHRCLRRHPSRHRLEHEHHHGKRPASCLLLARVATEPNQGPRVAVAANTRTTIRADRSRGDLPFPQLPSRLARKPRTGDSERGIDTRELCWFEGANGTKLNGETKSGMLPRIAMELGAWGLEGRPACDGHRAPGASAAATRPATAVLGTLELWGGRSADSVRPSPSRPFRVRIRRPG